ncbi:serine/threonine protein kinase [Alkalinema sp. FACHB-956]|nr:serine/threonine protein kinase [Alkalinema sp. FACHB-956]
MMDLVSNRYRVVRELGKGGFGTTSLVEDTQLPSGRRCVLKELMPVESSPEIYALVQQRFEREAAILEELGNLTLQIPSLYAYFAENGKFYLVQEYVEGETIAERVQTQGVMSDAAVREWLMGLLPVLGLVHERKIIHRDIKPENVILRQRDHKPVLIDFGAVRETMGTLINANGQSTQSIVIGTPGFMASEQAAGRPVFASDLYSLGLTAIYALTGKIPQELPTDPMTGNIQWRQFAPTVSAGLATVIDRAIMPVSRDRYQTSGQMQSELMGSNESNPIPGTVISMTPATISNPMPVMTVPPVEQYPNTNNSNSQPTIVVAHPLSSSSQPIQPQSPHSIAVTPKQGLSDWAKAMIMGGLIGTFILIAIVLTRPQQTTQASNNTPTTATTPAAPSPSPSTVPSPVATVSGVAE